jgi:hypothetical protein
MYIDPLGESKQINVRQYRRGNQKWTVSEKQDDEKQNKNTTQYVLDTTMRKQTSRLVTGNGDEDSKQYILR